MDFKALISFGFFIPQRGYVPQPGMVAVRLAPGNSDSAERLPWVNRKNVLHLPPEVQRTGIIIATIHHKFELRRSGIFLIPPISKNQLTIAPNFSTILFVPILPSFQPLAGG